MNVYLNSDNKRFRFVIFYRPEAGFNDFIQEFEEYLGILADCSTPTNICGDINCWTELSNDIYSVKMIDLLYVYDQNKFNSELPSTGGHNIDVLIFCNSGNFLMNFESDGNLQIAIIILYIVK